MQFTHFAQLQNHKPTSREFEGSHLSSSTQTIIVLKNAELTFRKKI